MYFKIANGIVIDSAKPISLQDILHHAHVLSRINGKDANPGVVDLLMVKARFYPFDQSPFWSAFKGAFPSAIIIRKESGM